jgi:5-(aminomethyl)-3-furanmethanol phosphate kinase
VTRPVVIKVGGSLFDWPDLPGLLGFDLERRRAEGDRVVLLAGGGRVADHIRELDRTFGLGDIRAHRLAVHSMDLTAHILTALLPGLVVVDELHNLDPAWEQGRIPVLAPRRWLDEVDARSHDPLPATWDVTSDAIAARLAVSVRAKELVLLKSAPLPPGLDRRGAARLGLVDPAFPDVSRDLDCVLYRNLRQRPCVSVALAHSPATGA